jgi:hypothetical protein
MGRQDARRASAASHSTGVSVSQDWQARQAMSRVPQGNLVRKMLAQGPPRPVMDPESAAPNCTDGSLPSSFASLRDAMSGRRC